MGSFCTVAEYEKTHSICMRRSLKYSYLWSGTTRFHEYILRNDNPFKQMFTSLLTKRSVTKERTLGLTQKAHILLTHGPLPKLSS